MLGAFIRLIMNDVMQTWKAHTETVGQVSAKLALVVQNLSKSEMAVKRKSEELEKLKEKHGAQEQVVTNCEDALETETKNVASYELEQDCMRKAIVSVEAYSYVEVRSMAMKTLMNQLATIAAASFAHSAAGWEDCAAKCRSVQARLEGMTIINA